MRIIGIEAEVDFDLLRERIPELLKRINSGTSAGIGTSRGVAVVQHWYTGEVFIKGSFVSGYRPGGKLSPGHRFVLRGDDGQTLIANAVLLRTAEDSEVLPLFSAHPEFFEPGDWYRVMVD